MALEEIWTSILSSAPSKGKCEICKASLEKLPSISGTATFMFKKFQVRVCVLCSKEVRGLLDARISQAERGEYQ